MRASEVSGGIARLCHEHCVIPARKVSVHKILGVVAPLDGSAEGFQAFRRHEVDRTSAKPGILHS